MSKDDDELALRWAQKESLLEEFGGKCSKCGMSNPVVLTLVEILDGGTLKALLVADQRISSLRRSNLTVLCINCCYDMRHRINRGKDIRDNILRIKGQNRCSLCGYSGNSLCFHHPGSKKFRIGDIIGRKIVVSDAALIDELSRCVVLCRSCHTLVHFDRDRYDRIRSIIDSKKILHKEKPKEVGNDRVMRMYYSGLGIVEISRRLECAKSTISRIVSIHKQGGVR